MNSEKIRKSLENLPSSPGVYRMRDSGGKIIYVGKAANLKKRVASYFQKKKH
ncbi:MAG: GIY-YIG nuclease family protein, partial [Candidatus Auribacterota bacterium]|nr:GIY-YIG nuclease family protein [Candidatus Auribacterota bacterium]